MKMNYDWIYKEFEGKDIFTVYSVPKSTAGGVTLPCALDLGQNSADYLERIVGGIVDSSTLNLLKSAIGLRGADADDFVAKNKSKIKFTDAQNKAMQDRLNDDCYDFLNKKLSNFELMPEMAKLSLISLVLNRGVNNKELAGLWSMLNRGDYAAVYDFWRSQQQYHQYPGVRTRRVKEAEAFAAAYGFNSDNIQQFDKKRCCGIVAIGIQQADPDVTSVLQVLLQ